MWICSVGGEKLLGMPDGFEPPHVALPPSGRLVRDFAAVVEIPALPMLDARQDLAFGGSIGSKFVGHDGSGHVAQTLQQLAEEALRCLFVATILNQYIEHVPMLINGSPEIVQFASRCGRTPGESRGGISPPRAPRTVRDVE